MKKYILWAFSFLCLFTAVILVIFKQPETDNRETLVITMPSSDFIRNIDTNYYKLWLEQKTGLRLLFNFVADSYSKEYLEQVFSSGTVKTDILFLSDGQGGQMLTEYQLERLGANGTILPLGSYIEDSVNFKRILTDFREYDLKSVLTSPDGNLYYVPVLDTSRGQRQVLWLNTDWLKAVKMSIPTTTEEFYEVLSAFRDLDPNGNGLADEIPLVGSMDSWIKQSYNYIINAFIYNDPENARLFVKNGVCSFAPIKDEWREAMIYLNKMYQEGLLSELQFSLNSSQLLALANDPDEIVGAFTSGSIAEVLLENSQETLSRFVHVAPLLGPDGEQNATARTPLPSPGAVILSSSENPDAAFGLLDLMLSEEAFLIARYGEKGIDWDTARGTDVDIYGNRATLRIIDPYRDKMQNKHFAGAGPYYVYPEYVDGVTWLGYDIGYFNGRAYLAYEKYQPDEHLGAYLANVHNENRNIANEIIDYTDKWLVDFIKGEKNPSDDSVWTEYLNGFKEFDIDSFINEAQRVYDLNGVKK